MTRRPAPADRVRGAFAALFPHHREHEPHQVVMWIIVAAALSLIATILVAGAAGYAAVASHLKEAKSDSAFAFTQTGRASADVRAISARNDAGTFTAFS